MRLTTFDDPAAFELAARDFFAAREAQYNLLAGLTGTLIERSDAYGSATPYLAIVHDDAGHIALVALRTPPHRLIVSAASDPAALGPGSRCPQALGVAVRRARAFRDSSRLRRKVAARDRRGRGQGAGRAHLRAHRRDPAAPPGAGSTGAGDQDDRRMLLDWTEGFTAEAHGVRDRRAAERMVDQRLASRHAGLHLWIDGEPMCMAGASGPTATGIRIGVVYTPPERRRRGYASACVAALSQLLLDSGRQRCFLFTDLANPTSNSIYQAIGYQPVGDMAEIDLAPPPAGGARDSRRHLPGQRARSGAQSSGGGLNLGNH